MKIILTARVSGLGKIGDVVEVKNGYAKNFLIPMKKAICMTKNNEKLFEANKSKFEEANDNELKIAQSAQNKLIAQNIVIIENASDDGRLYGSVSSTVIAAKANEILGEKIIEKADIFLAKPIKEVGVYGVKVDLHSDVELNLTLVVSRVESEVEAVLKAHEKRKKDALKEAEKAAKEKEAAKAVSVKEEVEQDQKVEEKAE